MSEHVIWIAEATIREGKLEDFREVMKDLVAATSQEEGALHYEWYISEDNKEVYIYERYADIEAATIHLSTWEPNAERFIAAADFTRLTVLSDLPQDMRDRLSGLNTAYRIPFGGFKK